MNLQEIEDFEHNHKGMMPDVVIVRKAFPKIRKRQNKRIWKLNRLEIEHADDKNVHDKKKKKKDDGAPDGDKDLQEFMDDLEEDPEMRANINLYKVSPIYAELLGLRCDRSSGAADVSNDY